MACCGGSGGVQLGRRQAIIGAALALSPLAGGAVRAADQPDESAKGPQVGDHFFFLTGAHKDTPAKAEHLELGGTQIQAYPVSPAGVVRDGDPLNLVLLVRVGDQGLDDLTKKNSADGVVAYSATCTHQGCPVNQWSEEKKAMVCSCHQSTYDPKNSAKVIFGPAPQPVAGLPLKSENGVLLVAGPFDAPLGMQQG
jgi:rieske iron-sulfur protein